MREDTPEEPRPAEAREPHDQAGAPEFPLVDADTLGGLIHDVALAPARAAASEVAAGANIGRTVQRFLQPQATTGCCGDRVLILRRTDERAAFVYSAPVWATSPVPTVFATGLAVPLTGAAEIPAELIWRQFWKLVAEWLAKRGAAAAAVAALDGPLPIGDVIALGIGIWTVYELIAHWDELWAAAEAGATALFAQTAKKRVVGHFEQLNIHLARWLGEAVDGKDPDHQSNPGQDRPHWWDEIRNFVNLIRGEGLSERQIRKIIEDAFGSTKVDIVLAALRRIMQMLGEDIGGLWR